MNFRITTIFLACIFLTSCKKELASISKVKEIDITSINTQTTYKVWVVLPSKYDQNIQYQSLYLLDADASYLKTDKIAKLTEQISSVKNKQNVIVVGISSASDRNRDFTPTKTDLGDGGSENYAKFISNELIPLIENNYNVEKSSKSRAILGHSLGGLLVGYFFINYPDLFQNYIMLSPSLWYDKHILFEYEKNNRLINSKKSGTIYLACGQLEETTVIESIEFNFRLKLFYQGFKHQFSILKNRTHISSALENAENGISFYFDNK